MFNSRIERNKFFESLFNDGIKYCSRKYFKSHIEERFNAHDVVTNSIIYIDNKLKNKEFDNLNHVRAWFFLSLRSQYSMYWRNQKRYCSLNAPIKGDAEITVEDFIASRLMYPTLEDEENAIPINTAVKSLSKEQQELIWEIWVRGRKLEEMKGNQKYLKRILDDAKLKLMRKLIKV